MSLQPPRALDKRFSPETRAALAEAFASDVKQKDLAREYGTSIRSVKRLLQRARTSGAEPDRSTRRRHEPECESH
ncbi:sigma factor-like helix-turn-helix DNA-binding protein [Glycomyces sp. YM15]|uniref:sigma factor-like helix-turn-helix DNA-binding protein n=1 Tax=Glycomyces sp. YM15 TaxID=2800446 RepID=UPI0019635D53|nr:sigma factor-like helix-turn-helix DNA-binding protein [Glycomyces sp. YM15]